jgi:tetratricopeptide (TPR) repeat protein
LCKVFYEYGLSYFFKNHFKKAEQYFLQILERLEGSGMDELISSTKFPLAVTYFFQAQWKKAATLYEEAIRSAEVNDTRTEYTKENPFLPYTHHCTHLGYIRALQGRTLEAKELIQKGYSPSLERISNLQSKAYCALWHSVFSALVGEDYGALARSEDVLKMAEKTDSPILCFLCLAAKGNAFLAEEEYEAARSTYEKALQTIKGTEHRRYMDAVFYSLVRVTLALGDGPSATRYYEEGFPLVQLNPEREAPRLDFIWRKWWPKKVRLRAVDLC